MLGLNVDPLVTCGLVGWGLPPLLAAGGHPGLGHHRRTSDSIHGAQVLRRDRLGRTRHAGRRTLRGQAQEWRLRQVSVSLDLIVLGLPVHDPAWIAAVGGLITACGGVAGGAIGALSAMLHGRKHTDAKLEVIKGLAAEAKEQTTNNHGTNMRDDLDALGDKLDVLGERFVSLRDRFVINNSDFEELSISDDRRARGHLNLGYRPH